MFVYIRATHFSDESAEGFPVLYVRIYVYRYIRATLMNLQHKVLCFDICVYAHIQVFHIHMYNYVHTLV